MAQKLSVFVTGGTGLIGRFVVENLLARGADVNLLVRASSIGSRSGRIDALRAHAARHGGTLHLVTGDLSKPALGLDEGGRAAIGAASHCFHLAALYDIEADDAALEAANIAGTSHLLEGLRAAGFAGVLHHTSSIAVAGSYEGTFTETMFAEGQKFPHAYHRTKYESERMVRESGLRYCIYRPGAVVGHSRTGEMDRVDGPYLGFSAMQRIAWAVPRWVSLPMPKVRGHMNLVPVDFVADAMVQIGLSGGGEGKVFHLVDPAPVRFNDMVRIFLRAFGGPGIAFSLDVNGIPGVSNALQMANMLPAVKEIRRELLEDFGLPPDGIEALNLRVRYDAAQAQAALVGSGIACPSLEGYARVLVRYYEDHLDETHQRPRRYTRHFSGKTVLVSGASRGIGAEMARQVSAAGASVLLVARDAAALESLATELRAAGGEAHVLPADLNDLGAVDALVTRVIAEHGGVDVLIHNAARSIRRPIAESLDRFHDFERTMMLNYFSPVRLTLGLLPGLRERRGSIANVLSMGVLLPGPYFSAYLASKSALGSFGDSLAAETHGDGVHVSQIYLPLVRTEMVAPTKDYAERKDLMTSVEAAHKVLDSLVDRQRRVMTSAGRFYALSNLFTPKQATRALNLLYRTFPTGERKSAFPMEKALIKKMIGGAPV